MNLFRKILKTPLVVEPVGKGEAEQFRRLARRWANGRAGYLADRCTFGRWMQDHATDVSWKSAPSTVLITIWKDSDSTLWPHLVTPIVSLLPVRSPEIWPTL